MIYLVPGIWYQVYSLIPGATAYSTVSQFLFQTAMDIWTHDTVRPRNILTDSFESFSFRYRGIFACILFNLLDLHHCSCLHVEDPVRAAHRCEGIVGCSILCRLCQTQGVSRLLSRPNTTVEGTNVNSWYLASHYRTAAIVLPVIRLQGYSVAFDPLDGSSIIDTNFAVGTIFGVWPGSRLVGISGRELAGAGMAVYGPRTTMTVAREAFIKLLVHVTPL